MLFLQAGALGLVALLLGLLVWKVTHTGEGSRLVSAIRQGERPAAPAFDLPVIWNRPASWPARVRGALDDGRVRLEELRGTPVVINFWASWCIPCREEASDLAAAWRAHRRDVAFLGLDIQDFTGDARRFLRELEVPYVSARDSSSETYTDYGLTGVPETYYLDREGRIVGHSIGAVSRRELEQQLAPLTGGAR
jgi:cytochrome c biogenesis protein CcmG/thiol:disulfide interchange protein DsbE